MSRHLLILVTLVCATCLVSADDTDSYVAAVFEYSPIFSTEKLEREDARKIMFQNLENYQLLLDGVKSQAPQIAIFPEDGLYGDEWPDASRDILFPYTEDIRNAKVGTVACQEASLDIAPTFQRLSCLALRNNITVVAVMTTTEPCTPNKDGCNEDGRFQYNTQVAFDERGAFLARYHKSHLFFEPGFDQAAPEPVTFTTSFGVTFGMLICFDQLWAEPQRTLFSHGVQNFALSLYWQNFPPFMTATQVQRANSYLRGINLLASNIGLSTGSSGSGIYSNGEVIKSFFNTESTPSGSSMVARIPKKPSPHGARDVTQQSVDVDSCDKPEGPPTIVPLRKNSTSDSLQAVTRCLTCNLKYQLDSPLNETFALVAFAGNLAVLPNAEVCALVKCPDEESSCFALTTPTITASTTFTEVKITGTFSSKGKGQMLALFAEDQAALFDTNEVKIDLAGKMSTQNNFMRKLINFSLLNNLDPK